MAYSTAMADFNISPPLHDEDVEHVLSKTIRNIVRACGESILGEDDTEPSALGLLDGQALVPLSSPPRLDKPPEYKPLTARAQGFTLHAATRVAASNPRGLFRLCAYGARGAIASSRLSRLPSGTFAYELKRPLSDGRKTLVWTGEQLVRKLVPPPVSEDRSAPLRESHSLSRGIRAQGETAGTGRSASEGENVVSLCEAPGHKS